MVVDSAVKLVDQWVVPLVDKKVDELVVTMVHLAVGESAAKWVVEKVESMVGWWV